jgi:hypothetical protein
MDHHAPGHQFEREVTSGCDVRRVEEAKQGACTIDAHLRSLVSMLPLCQPAYLAACGTDWLNPATVDCRNVTFPHVTTPRPSICQSSAVR